MIVKVQLFSIHWQHEIMISLPSWYDNDVIAYDWISHMKSYQGKYDSMVLLPAFVHQ